MEKLYKFNLKQISYYAKIIYMKHILVYIF